MKREALVIGAQGLIGRYLTQALDLSGISWQGTYCNRENAHLIKLDLLILEDIRKVIFSQKPSVVFICSNLSGGVDFSERYPEKARAFYVEATQRLGICCREIQAQLFLISSDYIFDGENGPYHEESPPHPLNIYGRIKWEAEEWLKKNLSSAVIVRTMNVYGWDPLTVTPNYVMQMYRALKGNESFYAPSYLSGQPTYAGDLARSMVELYHWKAYGTYHIVGSQMMNRWEWACVAAKIFNLNFTLIQERKTPSIDIVPRPFRPQFDCKKFKSSFKTDLHDVSKGLQLMWQDM